MASTSVQQRNNTKNKKEVLSSKEEQEAQAKLFEQLDKAEYSVKQAREAARLLHSWWRAHLFRISLLVTLFALWQCRAPTTTCIQNIKTINNQDNEETAISGMEASMLILQNAMPEIVGVVLSSLLLFFLSHLNPPLPFATFSFMIASLLVPIVIVLYKQKPTIGCADVLRNTTIFDLETKSRQFPMSVVFHSIVTSSCWFMVAQLRQRDRDVQAVLDWRVKLQAKIDEHKRYKAEQQAKRQE